MEDLISFMLRREYLEISKYCNSEILNEAILSNNFVCLQAHICYWNLHNHPDNKKNIMESDRCNIFDEHNKILGSVCEAIFESFRILQNKEQRRKITSLHCTFIYSLKTTLSIEEMEKISLQ